MRGLLGKKIGMTRVFNSAGNAVPVTILEVGPCYVVQVKTVKSDGYEAVQVGFGKIKNSKLTNQMKGFFTKKATEAKKILKEFRVENVSEYKEGNEIGLEILKDQKFVDITAKTIGKGFAGVMKRHNFGGLRASHGVSVSHRAHGSTGQNQDPGKVFKGKKMAGHMGDKYRTIQNLEIIKSDLENNLIFVKGSIPGAKNSIVLIQKNKKDIKRISTLEKIAKYKKEAAESGAKTKKESKPDVKKTAILMIK